MRISTAAALILLIAPHTAPAQSLEGTWRGRVKDRRQQSVEFELQIAARGVEPAGKLQALGRGAVIPFFVDTVMLSPEGTARVEIQTLRIVIEGKLASGGQSISAAWTQFGSDRQPVQLTRVPSGTPPALFDPLVEVRVPKPPTAVRVNGAWRLDYEIHVSNYTELLLELQSVDIQIGERTLTIAGGQLARQTVSYGVSVPPTRSGVVLVGLGMASPPPDVLRHRITFSSAGRTSTMQTQAIPVARNPVRIAPPLLGGDWWAGAGPDSSLHHRAAILPMDGRLTIAQRCAFDFARRVPGSDEFERGDLRQLASSPSYGADVLAVADATVAMVRDGVPDAAPYEIAPPHPITKETLGGNLVVLDLGQQHWAVYAHLQPGSLRVRQGDRVRRGGVIARLGNSASYSAHLHFHIVDGPDPFSSEGVSPSSNFFAVTTIERRHDR
jgi:hypothetical protein